MQIIKHVSTKLSPCLLPVIIPWIYCIIRHHIYWTHFTFIFLPYYNIANITFSSLAMSQCPYTSTFLHGLQQQIMHFTLNNLLSFHFQHDGQLPFTEGKSCFLKERGHGLISIYAHSFSSHSYEPKCQYVVHILAGSKELSIMIFKCIRTT